MNFCCDMMKNNVDVLKYDEKQAKEHIIFYNSCYDEYFINYIDGGMSGIVINSCPWCRKELPPKKRLLWFDVLEELGFDDPWDQEIPEDFKSNVWYTDHKYDDIIEKRKNALRDLPQSEKLEKFKDWAFNNFAFEIPDDLFVHLSHDNKLETYSDLLYTFKELMNFGEPTGLKWVEDESDIHGIYKLYPKKEELGYPDLIQDYTEMSGEFYGYNFLPLFYDSCGNIILLNCMSGEDFGKVYFNNHETGVNSFISNSLNEFLSSLHS